MKVMKKVYISSCFELRLDSKITYQTVLVSSQDVGLDREHHKTAWTWRGQEKDNRADMIEDV